jgi:hypothetical protein
VQEILVTPHSVALDINFSTFNPHNPTKFPQPLLF